MTESQNNDKKHLSSPASTEIEVICIKGERVLKKVMTYKEALKLEKKSGWKYIFYQIGFSSFKLTK